jgi:membrane protein DedA with SNARE-associated domain
MEAKLFDYGRHPLSDLPLRLPGHPLWGDGREHRSAFARRDHTPCLRLLGPAGHLDLGEAIAFGILGALIGDQIGYWVGREGGRLFVLRWGRFVLITPQRLARAEAFFGRHGGKAVFMARFFSGLRLFGALVAGISLMRWAKFALYNALGGALWATAVVLLGYFLGSSIGLVERWLGRGTLVLASVVAVVVVFYLAYRWAAHNRQRLVGWGEALLAYPPVARLLMRYDAQLTDLSTDT